MPDPAAPSQVPPEVPPEVPETEIERERLEVLRQLEDWLEWPLIVLGFIWLALLALELTRGLTPQLELVSTVIWVVFILDFLLKLTLAPRKLAYLRASWLTALALAVPALRVLRLARAIRLLRLARTARGLRLFRLLTSFNRGMRALRAGMGRRGAGYAAMLTLLVIFLGAAGMYAFESPAEGGGLASYGDALWWTAMLLTTLGSEYWPQTPSGRLLCFGLSLYTFGVFGYITASLASFFVDRDAEAGDSAVAGAREIAELRAEIELLRAEIREGLLKR